MAEIPGYYYDPVEDVYFKIPNYWDAPSFSVPFSDGRICLQCHQKSIRKSKPYLRCRNYRNVLQDLDTIALSKCSSKSDLFTRMHFKCLNHKQRIDLGRNVVRSTLVESGIPTFHLITDLNLNCELRRYNIKWKSSQKKSQKVGFTVTDTIERSQNLDYVSCLDARTGYSENNVICLSSRKLTFLEYIDDAREYRPQQIVALGRKCHNSSFALEALRPHNSLTDFHSEYRQSSMTMFYNHKTISAFDSRLVTLLTLSDLREMSHVSLSNHRFHSIFTAVGSASCSEDLNSLNAYVCVGTKFSLLSFVSPKRERELIAFGECPDVGDISHIQCILSTNNERSGVIVGRIDGLTELWDDRQPKSPAVVYKGSRGTVKNGMPPRPAVDSFAHSFVATPLRDCGTIGVWQLHTGELVNTLECSTRFEGTCFGLNPPLLVVRSSWGCGDGKSYCGPVVMAIHGRLVDFFY